MTNKDIKLNIKVDAPASSQGNQFLSKLMLATGLSISTAFIDKLSLENPIVLGIVGLMLIIIIGIVSYFEKGKI